MGIGQELIKRSLNWMDTENVEDMKIVVATGNEELLPFYQLFGFFPRHMILENKK
jgi:predicted GNAT family N-acyltransferase